MDSKTKADCLVAIGTAKREVRNARLLANKDAMEQAIDKLGEAVESLAAVLTHVVDDAGPSKHAEDVKIEIDRSIKLSDIANNPDARD